MMNYDLGAALKSIRINRQLTHEELSKLSGINRYSISRIENNILSPSVDNLYLLCKALKIDLHELLFIAKWFKEPKTKNQSAELIIPLLYLYKDNK